MASKVVAFHVLVAADGLQARSKLEKAMQEWFEGAEDQVCALRTRGHRQVDAGAQVRGRTGRERGRCLVVGAIGVCAVRKQHVAKLRGATR